MDEMQHLEVDSFADKEESEDTGEMLAPPAKPKPDKATPDKPKSPTPAPAAPTQSTPPAARLPNPLDSPQPKKAKAAEPEPAPKPAKPKPAGKTGKGKVAERLSRIGFCLLFLIARGFIHPLLPSNVFPHSPCFGCSHPLGVRTPAPPVQNRCLPLIFFRLQNSLMFCSTCPMFSSPRKKGGGRISEENEV